MKSLDSKYVIAKKSEIGGKADTVTLQKGQSVEIGSIPGKIGRREAYVLNGVYLREAKKRPIWLMVKNSPDCPKAVFDPEQEIKIWYGRQLGEVAVNPSYNEKSGRLEKSSLMKATEDLRSYLGLNKELALKYINLQEAGYFEREKKFSLKQHWLDRTGIDLNNYKKILENEIIGRDEKTGKTIYKEWDE